MILPPNPILTAADMRAAEDRAIAAGSSVGELMERAGKGIAEWVHRLAAGAEVLILCGPGNNGGDGYVAARLLANAGMAVRVAALAEPRTQAATQARSAWTGPVEAFSQAMSHPAPILVDAIFGTGLSRPLDPMVAATLDQLAQAARLAVAVDVPSFAESDTGASLTPSSTAAFDVTLALGALKPAHVLEPIAARCGAVRIIEIGIVADTPVTRMGTPRIARPNAASHKYTRGMVAVVGGPMHGASELAALAAYRAGAGYVLLLSGGLPHPPHAIVRRRWGPEALTDSRIGALVIGPGLGRDERAREKLDAALRSSHPLVIDGDALHLLDLARLTERAAPVVLTPHAGEFAALFGTIEGSKIVQAQAAARRGNAVVVFKGADTVIAQPDGRAHVLAGASPWLSAAGTGDVLAGTIAAMLAQSPHSAFDAASAGVWLHAAAAAALNRCFLADELADALPQALERAHG